MTDIQKIFIATTTIQDNGRVKHLFYRESCPKAVQITSHCSLRPPISYCRAYRELKQHKLEGLHFNFKMLHLGASVSKVTSMNFHTLQFQNEMKIIFKNKLLHDLDRVSSKTIKEKHTSTQSMSSLAVCWKKPCTASSKSIQCFVCIISLAKSHFYTDILSLKSEELATYVPQLSFRVFIFPCERIFQSNAIIGN